MLMMMRRPEFLMMRRPEFLMMRRPKNPDRSASILLLISNQPKCIKIRLFYNNILVYLYLSIKQFQ
jgi:hypothetical protein